MKHKFSLPKFMLSFLAIGLILVSCEKEELSDNIEPKAVEIKEAPFKNYMVIFKDGQSKRSIESFFQNSRAELVKSIPEIGVAIVNSENPDFIQSTMKSSGEISVVPNYEIQWIPSQAGKEVNLPSEEVTPPSTGNSEPFYFYLWGMDAINAPEAWNAGFTGEGASVFVLDSGIDAEHPDLSPNLNKELSTSFYPGEGWNIRPGNYFNHGTHVAGTIAAADNNFGVIGVAHEAELVAVKVLSEFSGSGPFSAINAGIIYAANNGADVINMSLGATLNKNGTLIDADGNEYKIPAVYIQDIILAQQRAVNYAYSKGTTVIASAGNDGINYDGFSSYIKLPGGLNNVVTISATAPEGWFFDPSSNYDVPASYTSHGRSLIDLAAPGGDGDVSLYDMIVSTGSNGWYFSSGTSMAAPHASGVAALIIAKNGGEMAPHNVEKQLIKTADHVDTKGQSVYFGKGRINAYRAVTE